MPRFDGGWRASRSSASARVELAGVGMRPVCFSNSSRDVVEQRGRAPRPGLRRRRRSAAAAGAAAPRVRGRTSSIVISVDVPLREDDDRRALRLARDVGDGEILVDDPLGRVDQDERDVGAARPPRARAAPSSSSIPCRCLRLRRRPAVSTSTNVASSRCEHRCRSRRASCPGTSETITRSAPTSAFSSDDLPTFGRPRIATRIASSPDLRRPLPGQLLDDLGRAGRRCRGRAAPRAGTDRRARACGTRRASRSRRGSSILFASTSTGFVRARSDRGELLVARRDPVRARRRRRGRGRPPRSPRAPARDRAG